MQGEHLIKLQVSSSLDRHGLSAISIKVRYFFFIAIGMDFRVWLCDDYDGGCPRRRQCERRNVVLY